MMPELRVDWEAEVRSLYDGMVVRDPDVGEAERSPPGNVAVGCREPARGSVPGVNTATMGRTAPRRT